MGSTLMHTHARASTERPILPVRRARRDRCQVFEYTEQVEEALEPSASSDPAAK